MPFATAPHVTERATQLVPGSGARLSVPVAIVLPSGTTVAEKLRRTPALEPFTMAVAAAPFVGTGPSKKNAFGRLHNSGDVVGPFRETARTVALLIARL